MKAAVVPNPHHNNARLRATMSPARVPERITNTGAQKCVVQRVNASGRPTMGSFIGSIDMDVLKKSRVRSMAMITIARSRSISMEVRR